MLFAIRQEADRIREIAPPVANFQSGFPLPASSAKKNPSLDPPKTSPPPVESSPAQGCDFSLNYHTILPVRSEEHTSELQSQSNLVCRLLLEKKKKIITYTS